MTTHVFRLHPGQNFREEVDKYVREHNIRAGVILTCVGNLTKAVLRMADAKVIKTWEGNAILDAGDAEMMRFAKERLNYRVNKGLDFIGRFNGKYVIGEAKFLTDFGGHQNAQFNDAITTLKARGVKAITVAILDGVLYIKGRNKMYKAITGRRLKNDNIMSTLVLREFLYHL